MYRLDLMMVREIVSRLKEEDVFSTLTDPYDGNIKPFIHISIPSEVVHVVRHWHQHARPILQREVSIDT